MSQMNDTVLFGVQNMKKHTHAQTVFNSHFPGKPGLASCSLASHSPIIFYLGILIGPHDKK